MNDNKVIEAYLKVLKVSILEYWSVGVMTKG